MNPDALVKLDITVELEWEPSVNAVHVGVAVEDGVVTLSGVVNSTAEREEAVRVAWAAPGVTEVHDRLVVRGTLIYA